MHKLRRKDLGKWLKKKMGKSKKCSINSRYLRTKSESFLKTFKSTTSTYACNYKRNKSDSNNFKNKSNKN